MSIIGIKQPGCLHPEYDILLFLLVLLGCAGWRKTGTTLQNGGKKRTNSGTRPIFSPATFINTRGRYIFRYIRFISLLLSTNFIFPSPKTVLCFQIKSSTRKPQTGANKQPSIADFIEYQCGYRRAKLTPMLFSVRWRSTPRQQDAEKEANMANMQQLS